MAQGNASSANETSQAEIKGKPAGISNVRANRLVRKPSTPQKAATHMGQGHQAAGGPGASGQGGPKPPPMLPPNVAYDLSLQHPRSVFQLLKQQYSRYTPEMVERITGIPKDQFVKLRICSPHSQRRRHEESRNDHLRRRLDATHIRHSDHSHRCDPAIAAGKRRSRGWRRECVARSLKHSGRNRHGRRVRHLPRLPQDSRSRRYGSGDLSQTHDAHSFEAKRVGLV
jgi:hypothetical protein